ncbi:type II toxin-antitoxin system Phd/YefM family antitoxin [bacterium]|nr:type II toxin-antitoxin system Phd/YefM family antitoxin [bacterium]
MKKQWQLQEAKNKLSEVIKNAINEGPQIITLRGKETVVLLSISEYRKLSKPKRDIVEFFQDSPLRGIDLDLERSKDIAREVEF